MGQSILYRWFGIGRLPSEVLSVIEGEGVIVKQEGLSASITFRRFRAPGRYHGYKKSWFCGSIVLTREHLLAFRYGKPVIGLTWADAAMLTCEQEDDRWVSFQYQAEDMNPEWSGEVTVRYRTDKASSIRTRIRQETRRAQAG